MQVYKLLYMVKITLAMFKKKKPNQSMLTVRNFRTQPTLLMKPSKEPRNRPRTHVSLQEVKSVTKPGWMNSSFFFWWTADREHTHHWRATFVGNIVIKSVVFVRSHAVFDGDSLQIKILPTKHISFSSSGWNHPLIHWQEHRHITDTGLKFSTVLIKLWSKSFLFFFPFQLSRVFKATTHWNDYWKKWPQK